MREGIPYALVGGLKFYDRAEIKDILAYLKVLANPADSVSLRRIINTPVRGIGNVTVEKIEKYAAENHMMLYDAVGRIVHEPLLPNGTRLKLKAFHEMMERLRTMAERTGVAWLAEGVLEETGYIRSLEAENTEDALSRVENLQEFISAAEEFDETAEDRTLGAFLDRVALISAVDAPGGESDRVTLMTLHSAKGLEFPVVFMIGMEDGLLPHQRSLDDPSEIEEERRLCYVGMTRARQKLYLVNTVVRRIFGEMRDCIPSMFLSEMPEDVVERVGEAREFIRSRYEPIPAYGF